MKDLKEMLDQHAILIGSRAWGGYTADSDYDYILDTPTLGKILEVFDNNQLKYDDIFGASDDPGCHKMHNELNIKIVIDGVMYNLMSYHPSDMYKIRGLNESMKNNVGTLIGDLCKKDKNIRIKVVECYFDILFNNNETPPVAVVKNNNKNVNLNFGGIFNE